MSYKFFKIDKFLSRKNCKKIIEEIDNFKNYDDLVMNGRKRINKGSDNFKSFLKKSKNSKKFFNKINNISFLNKIDRKIKNRKIEKNQIWKIDIKKKLFSKSIYGAQKGNKVTNIKTNLNKNIIYLDMDFSVSESGYNRGPHRDRDSRILNFLVYLNTLDKKDGGKLFFYDMKNKRDFKYPRFPKKKDLFISASIPAKEGVAVFFPSTPDSYHAVSRFIGKKNKKRFFIYGSFSLNKEVIWNKS